MLSIRIIHRKNLRKMYDARNSNSETRWEKKKALLDERASNTIFLMEGGEPKNFPEFQNCSNVFRKFVDRKQSSRFPNKTAEIEHWSIRP